MHAAKLGAYRDHVFFPSVSIKVSGKELGTPHGKGQTQQPRRRPQSPLYQRAEEWPRRERLSVQAAVGEAAQGKCRWLCPAVQMFSFLPTDGS